MNEEKITTHTEEILPIVGAEYSNPQIADGKKLRITSIADGHVVLEEAINTTSINGEGENELLVSLDDFNTIFSTHIDTDLADGEKTLIALEANLARQVAPPENLDIVASPITPADEVAPAINEENPAWKKTIEYINAINLHTQEKKLAKNALHGVEVGGRLIPGSVQTLNSIDSKLAQISSDERTLTRDEHIVRAKLLREQGQTLEREEYTKKFIETTEEAVGGNVELALRNFETLPEELQGAIRTGDKKIFDKYGVNTWAAKKVADALEENEAREAERLHAEQITHKEKLEKISAAIIEGNTTRFSGADINEALREKGISFGDTAEGIKIFKEQYEQQKKLSQERVQPPRKLIDRVLYAVEQGETIPEHTITTMLKSSSPDDRAWAEAEIAKRPVAPPVVVPEKVETVVAPAIEKTADVSAGEYALTDEEIARVTSIDEIFQPLDKNEYAQKISRADYDEQGRNKLTFNPATPQTEIQNIRRNVLGARGTQEIEKLDADAAYDVAKKENTSVIVEKQVPHMNNDAFGIARGEQIVANFNGTDYPGILRAYSPDGKYAFMEGSNTGIPVERITKSVPREPASVEKEHVTPLASPYDTALHEMWNVNGYNGEVPEWELVPMTDKALETEAATLESLVVNNDMKGFDEGEHLIPSIYEAALRRMGLSDDAPSVKPITQTPDTKGAVVPQSQTEKTQTNTDRVIHDAVAKQFAEKFGVSEESLAHIESFADLTVGQQVLVLKNLEQLTFSDITKEAREQQKAEYGKTPLWRKVVMLGMLPALRTAQIEKELLTKARGVHEDSVDAVGRYAKKLAYIESLSDVAKAGPGAEIKNGTLEMHYVSRKDIFESLDDKKLTGEGLLAVETFNTTASEYAKIPHEWRYNLNELAKKDLVLFTRSEQAYIDARTGLLSVFEKKFIAEREKNPEERAMLQMNALDERVALNQLFNTHPDAERALTNIQDQSIIRRAAKDFWKAKGNFIAYGIAGRAAVVSAVGALIPPVGATMLALGAVTGAGYLVGKKIGTTEGENLMRERRADGRMSEEDEREEIEYNQYKHENGKRVLDEEGNPIVVGIATSKLKEFTDATFFTDRIDRLVGKLEKTTDANERVLIEKKIAQTTTLMSEKLNHGMINFGGSALAKRDERKGDTIANRLSFMQALAKGTIETTVDQEKISSKIEQAVGLREAKIDELRKIEITRMATKAAYLRAGFALAGASLAEVASQYMNSGTPDSTQPVEGKTAQTNTTPRLATPIEESAKQQFVSAQELSYASEMSNKLGRPLSLIEERALWRTDPTFAEPNPNFSETPQGMAHAKILEALKLKLTLTQEEILNIYKSVGFDEAKGNQFPQEYNPKLKEKFDKEHNVAPTVPPSASVPPVEPHDIEKISQNAPQEIQAQTPPSVSVETPPRVLTSTESLDAVNNIEARIGRDMSGGEMVLVKSLKTIEVNAKNPAELATISEARIALVEVMRQNNGALSPSAMYHIMSQYGLENKVNIIQDAELRSKLFR